MDVSNERREDGAGLAADGPVLFFKSSRRTRSSVSLVWTPWVALVFVVLLVVVKWLPAQGAGAAIRFLPYAGLILAGTLVVFAVISRRKWRRRLAGSAEGEPDPDARFVCVGAVADITRHGAFQDTFFEPRIFKTGELETTLARGGVVLQLCVLLCIPIAYYALLMVGISGPVNPLERLSPAHGLACGLGGWAGMASVPWIRPVYFRLAPGRMDVMLFSAFRKQPLSVERVPLNDCRILVDLRRHVAFIDHPEGSPRSPVEMSIRRMRERTLFAHTLFLAAMSTSNAPCLPHDELMG